MKDFILKKTLKKNLKVLENSSSVSTIKRVGLLIDCTFFLKTEKLIQQLIFNGIKPENITAVVYYEKINNSETQNFTSFSKSQLSWNGRIKGEEINNFISQKFDLLISYYDVENAILLNVTHNSNADFKVGFSNIDNRFNHFMITTTIENYVIFVNELFKYLKLFNKL
jgi:hypothetical protein